MKFVDNVVFVDRVKGIIGLWVVDVFIIFEIIDYINVVIIMVVEKVVDIIKSEVKNLFFFVLWKYGMMGDKMVLGE